MRERLRQFHCTRGSLKVRGAKVGKMYLKIILEDPEGMAGFVRRIKEASEETS